MHVCVDRCSCTSSQADDAQNYYAYQKADFGDDIVLTTEAWFVCMQQCACCLKFQVLFERMVQAITVAPSFARSQDECLGISTTQACLLWHASCLELMQQ